MIFLTYDSYKSYSLIVMNPPYSSGDKHITKALDILERSGGQLVCLLNAETLNNPYSNIRKDLLRKLEEYNADIEFIQDAFIDADRQTNVKIALIRVNIEKPSYSSVILDELKQQEQHREESSHNSDNNLINADFIKGIVEQYSFEVKAGLKLIAEYEALKPLMLNSFKQEGYSNPILKLELNRKDEDYNSTLEHSYIKQIRIKYWQALFTSNEFTGKFTENLKRKYLEKVGELRNYDFSLYNIYTIRIQLNKELIQGIEDTILDLFNEFSSRHSMEYSKNIHYFNGWKNNKCWKVSKRVILPLNAYRWSGSLSYSYGNFNEKIIRYRKSIYLFRHQ